MKTIVGLVLSGAISPLTGGLLMGALVTAFLIPIAIFGWWWENRHK